MSTASTSTLLISSGNGPGECRQAVGHLLVRITEEARGAGLEVDIAERPAPHGPSSAVLQLTGVGAEQFAQSWEGVILWRCQSALRPLHRRKNWFIQVFRLEGTEADIQIDPQEIEMQAIRAGGPGGQHQNKTASAIRARWQATDGNTYAVVVRDQRSQHQNRRIAVERLCALVAANRAGGEAERRYAARGLHHQIERGNPARVFEGSHFRPG